MELLFIFLDAWLAVVATVFVVVYGRDLARRRIRDRRRVDPLARYIIALHVCVAAIMGSLLLDRLMSWRLSEFRLVVLFGVAITLTYGLGLLLHYRRS